MVVDDFHFVTLLSWLVVWWNIGHVRQVIFIAMRHFTFLVCACRVLACIWRELCSEIELLLGWVDKQWLWRLVVRLGIASWIERAMMLTEMLLNYSKTKRAKCLMDGMGQPKFDKFINDLTLATLQSGLPATMKFHVSKLSEKKIGTNRNSSTLPPVRAQCKFQLFHIKG